MRLLVRLSARRVIAAATVAMLAVGAVSARAAPVKGGGGSVLPGASSKEPISVDAAKLDYFDKEQKLVYSGDVVAKQGESTLKGSVLTIFLTKDPHPPGEAAASAPATPGAGASIDRMEVKGPVTVISKDEVGTGDNGTYEKTANRITLVGNVTLTQATNVIKGDKLVYDMTSGQAQVTSGQTQGRVRSVFTPGSGASGATTATPHRSKATAKGGGDALKPDAAAKTP